MNYLDELYAEEDKLQDIIADCDPLGYQIVGWKQDLREIQQEIKELEIEQELKDLAIELFP